MIRLCCERFEVLTAVKIALVFWAVPPCEIIYIPAVWRNILPQFSALKIAVLHSSETLVSTYKSMCHYSPEDQHQQTVVIHTGNRLHLEK
jgi:hypothetical protein